MDILFCLRDILSDFRHLFNQQNFALFEAFIFGFIANRGRGTLTEFLPKVFRDIPSIRVETPVKFCFGYLPKRFTIIGAPYPC